MLVTVIYVREARSLRAFNLCEARYCSLKGARSVSFSRLSGAGRFLTAVGRLLRRCCPVYAAGPSACAARRI